MQMEMSSWLELQGQLISPLTIPEEAIRDSFILKFNYASAVSELISDPTFSIQIKNNKVFIKHKENIETEYSVFTVLKDTR